MGELLGIGLSHAPMFQFPDENMADILRQLSDAGEHPRRAARHGELAPRDAAGMGRRRGPGRRARSPRAGGHGLPQAAREPWTRSSPTSC